MLVQVTEMRQSQIFLAATQKDAVVLTGMVSAGVGTGTLGRNTCLVSKK